MLQLFIFLFKILMSVQLIMETVNSCVIIALEATGALVLLDTHWIQTTKTVQVHTTVTLF